MDYLVLVSNPIMHLLFYYFFLNSKWSLEIPISNNRLLYMRGNASLFASSLKPKKGFSVFILITIGVSTLNNELSYFRHNLCYIEYTFNRSIWNDNLPLIDVGVRCDSHLFIWLSWPPSIPVLNLEFCIQGYWRCWFHI